MSIRTPNYVTDCDVTVSTNRTGATKILPTGSFVRPISREYLPKHVLDKYKDCLSDYYIFVFCHWGIIPVSKYYVREI